MTSKCNSSAQAIPWVKDWLCPVIDGMHCRCGWTSQRAESLSCCVAAKTNAERCWRTLPRISLRGSSVAVHRPYVVTESAPFSSMNTLALVLGLRLLWLQVQQPSRSWLREKSVHRIRWRDAMTGTVPSRVHCGKMIGDCPTTGVRYWHEPRVVQS